MPDKLTTLGGLRLQVFAPHTTRPDELIGAGQFNVWEVGLHAVSK